jgi:hypothetical protein
VPGAHILDLLHTKQSEIKQRLGAESERLARVEEWLAETQRERKMPDYEIIIKNIKPQKAITIRRVLPSCDRVGELFATVGPYLGKTRTPVKEQPIVIYHDNDFKGSDVDV